MEFDREMQRLRRGCDREMQRLLLEQRKSQKIPLAISPSDHYDRLQEKKLFNARIADFIQNGKLVVPCHTTHIPHPQRAAYAD